jgi:hypothetical protein
VLLCLVLGAVAMVLIVVVANMGQDYTTSP